jgi:predicted nucleotidyltransferase
MSLTVDAAAQLARAFLAKYHPNAVAAVLGGSAGAGTATPTSDLDLCVLYERPTVNYVDSLEFEGRFVEVFVYDHPSIEPWLAKEIAERRPVLHSMWATGILLVDDGTGSAMAERARRVLADGPAPLGEFEQRHRRYALSSAVDDLRDRPEPSAEQFAVMSEIFTAAAELVALTNRRWIGRGKWLARRLREVDDPRADALLAWSEGSRERSELIRIAESVLEQAGGYLQAGFRRGERPSELDPA